MVCKTGGGGKCQEYATNSGRYGTDEEGRPIPVSMLPRMPIPRIPGFRGEVFRSPRKVEERVRFAQAVLSLTDVSQEEINAYMDIFAAEGGMALNGSGAFAGIQQDVLDHLIDGGFLPGIAKGTRNTDLTIEQVAQVYRAYFDDVFRTIGGHDALNRMGSDEFARAAADTLLQHGRYGGTVLIQIAINVVRSGAIPVDGQMGSGTLGEIKRINAIPTQQKFFRSALAKQRNDALTKLKQLGKVKSGNDSARFSYFEFK
ncbi:MAG: hypothetical protein HQL51_14550 [Magnetococcales bacterium]|nr:hypothetical protein [Magnetococcales bacterium]